MGGDAEVMWKETLGRLQGWSSCVQDYTRRDLTFPSDKLYAISGVADILNYDGEMGEYLSGVWSSHFVAGLTWMRRDLDPLTPPSEYRAPTWSWASVEGAVLFEARCQNAQDMWPIAIKLLQNNVCLQDPNFPYGAVEKGSYIVADGACITRSALSAWVQLQKSIFEFEKAFDMSDACPCSCDLSLGDGREDDPSMLSDVATLGLGEEMSCGDGHFDFYLLLHGDEYAAIFGEMYLLMMSWVSRSAAIARRVVFARLVIDLEADDAYSEGRFRESALAADWKRMELKLV